MPLPEPEANATDAFLPRLGRDRWPLVLILAATVAAFSPVFGARFVAWDDQVILTRNPTLNPPTWHSLGVWWTTPHEGLYTPMAYTIWGGVALLARRSPDPQTGVSLAPLPFHVANLLIHCLTVAVVYFLLRFLVKRPWPAAAAAGLFALHPVQTESVAHASGIQGLLCVLFGLTAVLQYLYFAAPALGDRRRVRYAAATAAFVLAVLCKPVGTMVPLVAAILDVLVLGRPLRRAVLGAGPWVLAAAPFLWVTKSLQPGPRFDVDWPLWVRPFVAADAVAFYWYKLVFPTEFGIVYGRTPSAIIKHNWIFYTWLVPAAAGVLLWQARRVSRPLVAAAGVFCAALLPVSGLLKFNFQQFSTVADRYLYLPMFGVALAAAWGLSRPWCRAPGRAGKVAAACALILVGLGVRTWFQARHWHDTRSLFENAHRVNPAGGRVTDGMAVE